ncbi:hypothetical protein HYFRA_00012127 [Hymenoscyphus fraxineus]|uniref:Uncharacterized protein n=1 Tax=Hymenoscyphus fraxineus TaxID=746836 RepID=A0A9N9PX53_9HELO|nr:hypothetical protein HYFRA_00012127 [Hymenoscyphus fraxineus]
MGDPLLRSLESVHHELLRRLRTIWLHPHRGLTFHQSTSKRNVENLRIPYPLPTPLILRTVGLLNRSTNIQPNMETEPHPFIWSPSSGFRLRDASRDPLVVARPRPLNAILTLGVSSWPMKRQRSQRKKIRHTNRRFHLYAPYQVK